MAESKKCVCGNEMTAVEWKHQWVCHRCGRTKPLEEPPRQTFLEWELENNPHMYDKPRCNEFIDRQTLTHVVCNVDCPAGVPFEAFTASLNAVAETLDKFPYLKVKEQRPADLKLLEECGFEL